MRVTLLIFPLSIKQSTRSFKNANHFSLKSSGGFSAFMVKSKLIVIVPLLPLHTHLIHHHCPPATLAMFLLLEQAKLYKQMASQAFGNCYKKRFGALFPQIFSWQLYFSIGGTVKHSSLKTEHLCLPSLHPTTHITLCYILRMVYFLHNTFYFLRISCLFVYLYISC